MLHTTLSSAWSRKRRLAGTALAVVLGIAFLAATLVIGDSARAGFRTAFSDAYAGTDALVRSVTRLTGADGAASAPIPSATEDAVREVDGVAAVAPSIEGFAQVLDADGEPIGGDGPPTTAGNWVDDPELTGWHLVDGRPPTGPGQVVIDKATADEAGIDVGSSATVLVPEPTTVTVTGIARFGDDDSIGGSTFVAFETSEAQRLLLSSTELVSGVVVGAADGISQDALVDRLASVLPEGTEAVTGATVIAEAEDQVESDFLGFFSTALLVFAFVALLVAGFSIFNTLSILVAQRTRESALLRALGASRRQVLLAALAEAAIVGVIGSVLGLAAGIGLAAGLLALMKAAGFGLPVDGVTVTTGAAVVSLVVGQVVTMIGGLAPALRASRVAPLAALRDVAVDDSSTSRWRIVAGGTVAAGGAALVLSGSSGEGGLPRAGIGAVALVVGVVLLGPIAARPIGSLLGAPLRARGVSGNLAGRNAVRNPRRTSGTAAALLVGVGVVGLFTVFGASVARSIEDEIDRSFGGDLVVEPTAWGGAGISPGFLGEVQGLREVGAAAGLGYGPITLDGSQQEAGFTDPAVASRIFDLEVTDGDLAAIDGSSVAMSSDFADDHGYGIGDSMAVGFADGSVQTMTLTTVYDGQALGGEVLLPESTWLAHNSQASYFMVLIDLADGASLADGRAAVESLADGRGGFDVEDRDEFVASQAAEIDVLLNVIYGLLGVAILIALMGIANTLSLSIHERTRELGLLRAVGQTRSQLRAMVRWESVIVATFGALGGLGIGVFLGWGLVRSLNAAEGFGTLALPVGSLTGVLMVGAVVGVLAGLRPAWRASRLDVLAAVAAPD